MEVEDDVFFADLSKRISLLIMDDDEDPVAHCPSVSLQAAIHPPTQPSFSYNQQNCRRESKGTGVFIPQLSHPRRKNNRQTKFSSANTKFHSSHSDDSSRGLQAHSSNFMNASSHNPFNPKRC